VRTRTSGRESNRNALASARLVQHYSMCVCVKERGEEGGESERENDNVCSSYAALCVCVFVCVCMCVCV